MFHVLLLKPVVFCKQLCPVPFLEKFVVNLKVA